VLTDGRSSSQRSVLDEYFRCPLTVVHLNDFGNLEHVSVMESEAEDNGWEDVYRLYGVCVDIIDDARPSRGEIGSGPTPITNFSRINKWF
jgi:hypothetical protein